MTTANKLTILRFILAVAFVVLFYMEGQAYFTVAFVVFVIACISDFLDGYIARKYKQETKLGKLIDPLADKVLVFAALILFVEKGIIWGWAVVIILSRDLMMGIFRAVAASQNVVIAADNLGKIKTATQMFSIVSILFGLAFQIIFFVAVGEFLFYFSVILTVVSGIKYVYQNREVLKE